MSSDAYVARLRHVDTHCLETAAGADAAWLAVATIMSGNADSRATRVGARVLGCRELDSAGAPTEVGATFPGWRIAACSRPRLLAYEGEHRFARYELLFWIDDQGGRSTRIAAATHADFDGLLARAYETAVIRSGAHAQVVGRMLRAIKHRAEDLYEQ